MNIPKPASCHLSTRPPQRGVVCSGSCPLWSPDGSHSSGYLLLMTTSRGRKGMSLPCVALTREVNLPRIIPIRLAFNEDSASKSRGGADFTKSHGCLEKLRSCCQGGRRWESKQQCVPHAWRHVKRWHSGNKLLGVKKISSMPVFGGILGVSIP